MLEPVEVIILLHLLQNAYHTRCTQIKQVVETQHEALTKDNMANVTSVQSYITAVRAARQSNQQTLSEIMQDPDNEDIRRAEL